MSYSYTYDPDAWHPVLAGAVAGSIAAIMAGLISLLLRSPDEVVANSLTVVLTSIALGLVAGGLWRRLRVSKNAPRTFAWSMAGGFLIAMMAIALIDITVLSSLIPYATPLAALIFITLGFFVPLLSKVTAPKWVAAVPIVLALAVGVGMFGRGNTASGELSIDDIGTGDQALGSSITLADDLADGYTVTTATATYTVDELLRGLEAQAVGTTESVTGSLTPGGPFTFQIDVTSFSSDQSRRDAKVRDWFRASPTAQFAGAEFDLPETAEVGETVTMSIPGTITINETTTDIVWEVEARLETDASLSIQGETDIVLSDYGVPIVTGGIIEMSDAAHLEVLLSLTPDD